MNLRTLYCREKTLRAAELHFTLAFRWIEAIEPPSCTSTAHDRIRMCVCVVCACALWRAVERMARELSLWLSIWILDEMMLMTMERKLNGAGGPTTTTGAEYLRTHSIGAQKSHPNWCGCVHSAGAVSIARHGWLAVSERYSGMQLVVCTQMENKLISNGNFP